MNAISRKLPTVARIALGLIFFVFGLNGFLHFLPQPPAPPRAMAFAGALFASGYFFPLLKLTELGAGLMLVAGVATPVALVILAPIIVNIVAFHAFLAPSGLPIALAMLGAELFLAWSYREVYAPLFRRGDVSQPAATVATMERPEAVGELRCRSPGPRREERSDRPEPAVDEVVLGHERVVHVEQDSLDGFPQHGRCSRSARRAA